MDRTITAFSDLTLEELYEILALRTEVFVVEQACPYLEVDGRDRECHHLQVREAEELVAYLRLLPRTVTGSLPAIGRVVVKKDYRQKGLARVMVQEALDFMKEAWQEEAVQLSAQTYLQDFYASFGFVPVSDIYLEDGIAHIDMVYDKKRS